MNLTDGEREELYRAARAAASAPVPPTPVVVVNPQEAPEMPDVSPALDGISRAVASISGKDIAQAIKSLAGCPEAINDLRLAVAKLEVAVKSIAPVDAAGIVAAINENTAELRATRRTMVLPKILVFDDVDDEKPIGIETVLDN